MLLHIECADATYDRLLVNYTSQDRDRMTNFSTIVNHELNVFLSSVVKGRRVEFVGRLFSYQINH